MFKKDKLRCSLFSEPISVSGEQEGWCGSGTAAKRNGCISRSTLAWQMAAFTAGCTQGRCEMTPPPATPQDNLSQDDKKKLVSVRNLTCMQQGGGRGAQERKRKQKVVPTSATPYPLCQEGLYSLPGGTQRLVKAAPGVLQFFSHFTGWAEICRPSELPHQHFHQNLWQKNKERASRRKQLRQEHFISLSFFLLLFNS